MNDRAANEPEATAPGRSIGRRIRDHLGKIVALTMVGSLVAAAVLGVLTNRWFISPGSTIPPSTDAVVVFAGGAGERLDKALELIDSGVSDVLILNEGIDWFGPESEPTHDLCTTGADDYEVVCVHALPDSTRGEAITISSLAEERGYDDLVLVTTDHHLTRSLRWLNRCFDGTVHGVAAPAATSTVQVFHEWASTVAQYTFDRSCDPG